MSKREERLETVRRLFHIHKVTKWETTHKTKRGIPVQERHCVKCNKSWMRQVYPFS